jgi:hypothetical protein
LIIILVTKLNGNLIRDFLSNYKNFFIEEYNIYINKILFKTNIIDCELYKKLQEENYSIIELALTTEFELSEVLQISIRKAFVINLISQFHYSNILNGLTIYYAHPKEKYFTLIEKQELNIIQNAFPFANIINPSDFQSEWKSKNYSESEIMARCLVLVSESDMVISSPLNNDFISRGVYEEINLAFELNITTYIIHENKLQHFSLGDINKRDWKNYCPFKSFSFLAKGMNQTFNYTIGEFFNLNQDHIEKNLFTHRNKYIIICNNSLQSESIVKTLYKSELTAKLKILPILGKKGLCESDHVDHFCESDNLNVEPENFDFFSYFRENNLKYTYKKLSEIIEISTPNNRCSYNLLYSLVEESNIIVINKIFFTSTRLRTKLRKEILFDDPFKFILIFDNISDLFDDHIESRCSDNDLKKFLIELKKINKNNYNKVSLIIQNLLELKEGEKIKVDYNLTKFLQGRYKKRELNKLLLEKIYDICKTPFGTWNRGGNEIIQIIESDSLKNFLNYFSNAIFLKTKDKIDYLGS